MCSSDLPLWWASAFTISLLILFHSIFWLGVSGIPIKLGTVLPILLAASAIVAWVQRKFSRPVVQDPASSPDTQDRILLLLSGVVGVVLLLHTAIAPSMGGDAPFRWEFLAQQLLAHGGM